MGQGKAKKTRKFAEVKRMMNPKDVRLAVNKEKKELQEKKEAEKAVHHVYARRASALSPFR